MESEHQLVNLSVVEQWLLSAQKSILPDAKMGCCDITMAIKRTLFDWATQNGYQVAGGSEDHADFGEWLYDLTILDGYRDEQERYILKSAVLVLESEWLSDGDIQDDFQKLLLANSSYKMMIFRANNADRLLNVFVDLVVQLMAFKGPLNGTFFLCGYNSELDKFSFEKISI